MGSLNRPFVLRLCYNKGMKQVELAYLAGIIDGEGCISFARRLKKYITPTLQVTNTNRDLIDWLHVCLGGNVYRRKDDRPTRKESWLWSVAGQKALLIIRDIRPYLLVKRKQADIVLALPRYAPGRDKSGRLQTRMTEADHRANSLAVETIRALNRRGRLP